MEGSLLRAIGRYFLIRDNKTDLLAIRYPLREEDWTFHEAEVPLGHQIIDRAAGKIVRRLYPRGKNRCSGSTD
jgi:hypothetical protein